MPALRRSRSTFAIAAIYGLMLAALSANGGASAQTASSTQTREPSPRAHVALPAALEDLDRVRPQSVLSATKKLGDFCDSSRGLMMAADDLSAAGPTLFIENVGQFPTAVRFQALLYGGDVLWLLDDRLIITGPGVPPDGAERLGRTSVRQADAFDPPAFASDGVSDSWGRVAVRLAETGQRPRVEGFGQSASKITYQAGADPSKWFPNVPTWAGVRYHDVYLGVNLEVAGRGGKWTWRFVAQDEIDLEQVQVEIEESTPVFTDDGQIRIVSPGGSFDLPPLRGVTTNQVRVPWHRPRIIGQRVSWPFSSVSTTTNAQKHEAKREIAAQALPGVEFATRLGISAVPRTAMVVGRSDDIWIAGGTVNTTYVNESDFEPGDVCAYDVARERVDPTPKCRTAFVARLTDNADELLELHFLGGRDDEVRALAMDTLGAVIAVGVAGEGWPVTADALQKTRSGKYTGFLARIIDHSSGYLLYSTYIGDGLTDIVSAVAVDANGDVVIGGHTAYPTPFGSEMDAWVARLTPDGKSFRWPKIGLHTDSQQSTGNDFVDDLEVSADGIWIVGQTTSVDFPTVGVSGITYGGNADGFISKLNKNDQRIIFSRYLGSGGEDRAKAITSDSSGRVYITGVQSEHPFVTILNTNGSIFSEASIGSGTGWDMGLDIAVDQAGYAYVSGITTSTDFWTSPDAFQRSHGNLSATPRPGPTATSGSTPSLDAFDAFLVKLRLSGSTQIAIYSTYIGGHRSDYGDSLARAEENSILLSGTTRSGNFTTTPGGITPAKSHDCSDPILMKFRFPSPTPRTTTTTTSRIPTRTRTPIPSPTRTSASASATPQWLGYVIPLASKNHMRGYFPDPFRSGRTVDRGGAMRGAALTGLMVQNTDRSRSVQPLLWYHEQAPSPYATVQSELRVWSERMAAAPPGAAVNSYLPAKSIADAMYRLTIGVPADGPTVGAIARTDWSTGGAAIVSDVSFGRRVIAPRVVRQFDGHSSVIAVANGTSSAQEVTLRFFRDGNSTQVASTRMHVLGLGALTLDLNDADPAFQVLGQRFQGSVVVEVADDAGATVGVQVLEYVEGSALAIGGYEGLPEELAANRLFVPLWRSQQQGPSGVLWNTLISVANTNSADAQVFVSYHPTTHSSASSACRNAGIIRRGPVRIPANSSISLDQGVSGDQRLPANCFGSAEIVAEQPAVRLLATITEREGDYARMSMINAVAASYASRAVALPLFRERHTALQYTTGIQVMNAGDATANVRIDFSRSNDGAPKPIANCGSDCTATIRPFESNTWWPPSISAIPYGTYGSAVVTSDQPVVVLVNDLPLNGRGDSATFGGIPLLDAPATTATPTSGPFPTSPSPIRLPTATPTRGATTTPASRATSTPLGSAAISALQVTTTGADSAITQMVFSPAETFAAWLRVSNSGQAAVRAELEFDVSDASGARVNDLSWQGVLDVEGGVSWLKLDRVVPVTIRPGPHRLTVRTRMAGASGSWSTVSSEIYLATRNRMSDDFSDRTSGWWEGLNGPDSFAYVDGEYRILFGQTPAFHWSSPTSNTTYSDVAIEGDVRMPAAAGRVALMFGLASTDDLHIFRIDGEGRFALFRKLAGEWESKHATTAASVLARGNARNHLLVVSDRGVTRLYANGTLLAAVNNANVSAGRVGLYAESLETGFEGRFDNVRAYDVR